MFPFWWEEFFVNIDVPAAEALGLAPGVSFRVEVADFVIDAIYFGEANPHQHGGTAWAKPLAGGRPEFGVAYRPQDTPGESAYLLHVWRVVAARPFPIHERWIPARVTLLPERYEIPSPGAPPAPRER